MTISKIKLNLIKIIILTIALLLPTLYARATSIGTNVSVTGTTTLSGNTTIGDSATADTLTVTARLAADLDPNANNTIDLGAFDLAYNNIFVSGTSYLGSVTTTMISPWANNTSQLGAYGNAWKDVFASGTSYLGSVTSTMINPWANNTSNLGAYGNAWKNLYASSTVFLTSVSTTQGIEAAADSDTRFTFGRAVISNGLSDYMILSHYDNTALANAAFIQSSAGATIINAKLGQNIGFYNNVTALFLIDTTSGFNANEANGPAVLNEISATTNPTLVPDKSDLTAGIGGQAGELSFITGGVERINIGNGGNVKIIDTIFPGTNNTYDLGTSLASWKNLYVTSTAFLRFVSSTLIEPYAKNSQDIGSYTLPWRNVYTSSSLFAASSTFSHPTATTTAVYGKAETASRGAQIILEDADGLGCTAIMTMNGAINGVTVACPDS